MKKNVLPFQVSLDLVKDSLSLQWVKMRNQIIWSSLLEASIKFHLEESGGYKLREKKKKTSYTSVKLCSNFLIVATELQNMSGNATSCLQILCQIISQGLISYLESSTVF